MELARVVLWAKMQLTMSEIKDTQFYVQEWANFQGVHHHYNDVIMSAMASQITSLTIVYSTVYSGTDQRKHKSSASLAFVRRIHRWPVNSPHKGSVTRKCFHLMTSWWLHSEFMGILCLFNDSLLAPRKICHRSPDNNFSTKTNWQKVWLRVKYVVIWVSCRKSAPLV